MALVGSFVVLAQNAPQGQRAPQQPMSFFVAINPTATGNLGGLKPTGSAGQVEAGSQKRFTLT
jgi:hypothetical protein